MCMEQQYSFKIKKLTFNDGSEISPKRINIIIGPNNSGKSRALKEIRYEILGHWSNSGYSDFSPIVLSNVQLNLPNDISEFENAYAPLQKLVTKTESGWRARDYCNNGIHINPDGSIDYHSSQPTSATPSINSLKGELDHSLRSSHEFFLQIMGPSFVSYSGTDERLILSIGEPARGIGNDSYNTLSSALDADPYLSSISGIVTRLFGKDVILDAKTNRQIITPLVSDDFSEYRDSISGTQAPDYSKLSSSTPLSDEGDGMRSFVAVLISLLGNKKPVYLLDEPESFLHPPYAFEMGKEIASLTMNTGQNESQLFISTHSSYLIRGVLSEMRKRGSSEDLQIIRLTRENNITHVHPVDTNELNEIVSTKWFTPAYVDALFSDSPVLTEGSRDAELFTQIIAKLMPVKDALFVAVGGKQNFHNKMTFYSSAGINARLIADFDAFKDPRQLEQVMKESGVPSELVDHGTALANKLHDAVVEEAERLHPQSEGDSKRHPEAKNHIDQLYKHPTRGTINCYGENLFEEIDRLITQLIPYGILIIRTGMLETIFPGMPKTKNTEHSDEWYYGAINYIATTEIDILKSVPFVKDLIALLEGQPG